MKMTPHFNHASWSAKTQLIEIQSKFAVSFLRAGQFKAIVHPDPLRKDLILQ
jgi:hypothetical protein